MAEDASSIHAGRMVYAWIADHNGHGKLRPALIVAQIDEANDDPLLVVMAITTTFPDPPPERCVPLPWHPRAHPVTRLRERSAAVVNWIAQIHVSDVVGFGVRCLRGKCG